MSEPQHIAYERIGRVGVITLDRPERRNAQNKRLLDQLDKAFDQAALDDEVRVIVLKANGPHFSAGHDMSPEGADVTFEFETQGLRRMYDYERVHYLGYSRKWRDIPKPTIAAVQGMCIAAGLMLVWPCDIIIAADNAVFSDPVVRMGIGGVEYHGHTWELGPRKAKELLFLAKSFDAAEAERLGMVNQIVPLAELEATTLAMAEEIAQMHPFALAMAKRAVNQTMDIMGQYNALQAVFDTHQLGHGSAVAMAGYPVLVDLEQMKKNQDRKK
ncbi:MAG: enoyl-CoA hydratase [Sphingorhabdus sp.]